jgi:uncharacterized protein
VPKPPRPEIPYFEKIDVHKRRKIAESKRQQMAKEELAHLKNLHWHRCGNCGLEMEEIPFKGETVFKCFHCGSVLLLEGALENLCGGERHIIESLLDLFKF